MSEAKERVLIVDDEPDIRELLEYSLSKEGYAVDSAANGTEALNKAGKFNPQYILLDIMMPDFDGIEVCRRLRKKEKFVDTFIIILTARGEEYSEVAGFDAGADDYIVKPIKIRSLVKRLKALKKRERGNSQLPLTFDGLEINRDEFLIRLDGKKVKLPKKEFELLYLLARNAGKVVLREDILSKIWGNEVIVGERTIDVHIRRIREKIGKSRIQTIKGVGYKFQA